MLCLRKYRIQFLIIMGKYSKYKKAYKKEWESLLEFKGWLTTNYNDKDAAYCKVCQTPLRPHKTDLKRHAARAVHKSNILAQDTKVQPKITNIGVSILNRESKTVDLRLALHVAVHSSIRSIDHLSELLIQLGKNSQLQNLKLHRTKCSMLIKNVIAPSLLENLIEDIGESNFSLIVDESTDISVCKYMAVCIRYFSVSKSKIVTNYLGIFEVTKATAIILTNSLLDFLKENKLSLNKLVGLGTDGANNLCGQNHSLYTLLKERVPRLQLIKCVAHSLHLCCSKASEMLPSSLDYLVRETYNWFSRSALRRSLYRETYELINMGTENKFYQFIKLSDTRWLARANAVKVILDQWLELKTHFSVVVEKEKCYMARTLREMYCDDSLYLYFSFVSPILNNINTVNLMFQSDSADILKIYSEVYMLLLGTLRYIVKPIFLEGLNTISDRNFKKIVNILDNPLALVPTNAMDFGYNFRRISNNCKLDINVLNTVKERCKDFIVALSKEICIRVPHNLSVVNCLENLSPENVLKAISRPKFEDLPLNLIKDCGIDMYLLEQEWKDLLNVTFNLPNNVTPEEFWVIVFNHKNACGNYKFRTIAKFALLVLSLPLSNAVVERVFSAMTYLKSKVRNKLNMTMLNALLVTKINLEVDKKCCMNYDIPLNMYTKFNSNVLYATKELEDGIKNNNVNMDNNLNDNYEDTITLFADTFSDINEM